MKIIKFVPTSLEAEEVVPPPRPSANYVPDWYKSKKRFDGQPFSVAIKNRDYGLKSCVPFLDSMINGYIQETWCDIHVDYNEKTKTLDYEYSTFPKIISHREKTSVDMGNSFYPFEMLWLTAWVPHMPKGYSTLITHPFNHVELPFFVLDAIIDSDKFLNFQVGNIPFYFKNDFTGVIPAGTPMYQIVPIKRESWHSSIKKFNQKKQRINAYEGYKKFYQSYKNNFHQKKVFK